MVHHSGSDRPFPAPSFSSPDDDCKRSLLCWPLTTNSRSDPSHKHTQTQLRERESYNARWSETGVGRLSRVLILLFAVASAFYGFGSVIYWTFNGGINNNRFASVIAPRLSPSRRSHLRKQPKISVFLFIHFDLWDSNSSQIEPNFLIAGVVNLSAQDCGRDDPELKKQFVDLLTEELRLQKSVAEENKQHVNLTVGEAKRVAFEYQKEAEKCKAATETCEEAREQAEGSLRKERKVSAMWERRARQFGWSA